MSSLVLGKRGLGPWLFLASLGTLPGASAQAAGFYIGDLGTKAMALGGAHVAAPDDLTALHYNPAGLAERPGFDVRLDLSLVASHFEFDRRCPCVFPERITDQDPAALDQALEATFRPATSTGLQPIPFLGAGYGWSWLGLTVAAAAYGPMGASYDWGPRDYAAALTQAQRYSLIGAESLEANYQLGAALSPWPGLRIGAGLIVSQLRSTQHLHIYANTILTPFAENVSTVLDLEGQSFDIPVALSFEDFVPTWVLGASYQLPLGFVVGGSLRGPRSIDTVGHLAAELPTILSEAGIGVENGGGDVRVQFKLPLVARAGLQWTLPEVISGEVAVVYEGWSVHDRVALQADAVRLTVGNEPPRSLGLLVLPRAWRDSASLRIGGQLHLLEPWVTLAAGYFYEPSAIPKERLSAAAIDLPKHGLSAGIFAEFSGVGLELAISHVFTGSQRVEQSEVLLPIALSPRSEQDPEALGTDRYQTRLGNGDYTSNLTVLSLAVSFRYR